MLACRDVVIKDEHPKEWLLEHHVKYLRQYAEDEEGTEQIMAEFLKMSGIYWALNALYLTNSLDIKRNDAPEIKKILQFIKDCQTEEGGFGAAINHDPHILHTLSAIQILTILGELDSDYMDQAKCVDYIKSLQQEDGSFFGDKWGEVDTRFSMCALTSLKLLNRLDVINLEKAADFVLNCHNEIDGGFGNKPGSESHAAYVYCCVGSIAIANKLDKLNTDQLAEWLAERQLPSGGLNGRPEKLPDLCYSWWCLASLKIIDKVHLIKLDKLHEFILACQDSELGGLSDRPGNCVDPYHTMFGIAGLSLICQQTNNQFVDDRITKLKQYLKCVDPVVCLPKDRLSFDILRENNHD